MGGNGKRMNIVLVLHVLYVGSDGDQIKRTVVSECIRVEKIEIRRFDFSTPIIDVMCFLIPLIMTLCVF